MANPIMKLVCINQNNPLYGLTALGHIRTVGITTHTGATLTDIGFCIQLEDTSHKLSNGWHMQNRQDWRNLDAKRPQTQDQRRSIRRTNDNMENERNPT